MDWNKFEDGLRKGLNNPPRSTETEREMSWDRLEPKLFPKKKRRAFWYSLNGILIAVLISLAAFAPWKKDRSQAPKADETINLGGPQGVSQSTDEREPAASSTAVYSGAEEKPAAPSTLDVADPSEISNAPMQNESEVVIHNSETTEDLERFTSSSPAIAVVNSQEVPLENEKPNTTMEKTIDLGAHSATGSYTVNNDTETEKMLTAHQGQQIASSEMATPLENGGPQAPKEILSINSKDIVHASHVQIVEENGQEIKVKTVSVDTGNLVAKIYRSPLEKTEATEEDTTPSIPAQNEEKQAEENRKAKKSLVANIKDNLSSEKDETRIRKPMELRMTALGFSNLKASGSYYGGIIGLEAVQELTMKLSLIAGIRYQYGMLNTSLKDESLTTELLRIDSLSGNESRVIFRHQKKYRNLKLENSMALEIPIYVNYSLMKNLMLQAGVNIDYLRQVSAADPKEWSEVYDESITMNNNDLVRVSPDPKTTGSITLDESYMRNLWGLGMHLGLEYNISPRIYAQLSFDKLLMQYFRDDKTKILNDETGAGQLRFGMGIRLKK